MKICLVASRGGHLAELGFARELKGEAFLITEKTGDVVSLCDRVYYVDPINRRQPDAVLKIIRLFVRANGILKAEQPDVFVSTGALISIPVLILGKLRKKKVIFVESMARVEDLSLSGKIAYRFADVFVVYWESLARKYPKATCIDLFSEGKNDPCDCGNPEVPV